MGGVKRGADRDEEGTLRSSLVTENTNSVLNGGGRKRRFRKRRVMTGVKEVIKREVDVSDTPTAHHRLSSMSWQLGSELCILSPSLRMRYSSVTPN